MEETMLTGESRDIVSDNVSKLKEIFPDVITEDKIDFEKLKLILGEDVETDSERYSFTWPGKTQAIKESQKQSTGTLRPCKEESKNWDTTKNLYIEGDNLEVLKLLQKSYYGKIKAIYIDPPYNTGKDFIYKDDYKDNLNYYLEFSDQVVVEDSDSTHNMIKKSTNTETHGRYHSNWLNMMYPRLKLARNLLKDEGVIFISIDDNEIENLTKICNEIFGEDNFIGNNIRKTVSQRAMAKFYNTQHEYCLIYCKNKSLFSFKGDLKNLKDYSNPDNDPNGVWKSSDPTIKGSKNNFEIINPYTNKVDKPPMGRGWGFTKEKFQDLLNMNKIFFKKKHNPNSRGFTLKSYAKDLKSQFLLINSLDECKNDYLNQISTKELNDLFTEQIFDYAKPTIFIERLLSFNKDDNDIILDFFSGSATTAHAVFNNNIKNNKNNRFILVQFPELTDEKSDAYKAGYLNICEIGKERIRRAGNKLINEFKDLNIDIGFKVFKLDSSNLKKWSPDYENLETSLLVAKDNIKPDRKDIDLIYEIMIKYGLDLTLPIEMVESTNNKIYSIGFGLLIVCLDDIITKDIVSEILKVTEGLDGVRVVFKDNGFASDSEKTNIKESLKTNQIEEFITI